MIISEAITITAGIVEVRQACEASSHNLNVLTAITL